MSGKSGGGNAWWILMLHATWIILLAVGVVYAFNSWRFVNRGERVAATVVELEVTNSDGISYSPIFEYQVGGKTYSYNRVKSSNPPTHRVGDQTTLLVMPGNPERARENSFWELWLLPVVMCPVGGLVAVSAIVATVAVALSNR